MKEIVSVNNEYIKYLNKLKERKIRKQENLFIVEGYHLVEEAYKANRLVEILSTDKEQKYSNINQIIVTEQIIKKISSTQNPQNIIGVCKTVESDEIKGNKILLLDNINDPGNLGTLIRSSLGFGFDTIIVSHDTVDVYNEKVIRASQGAIFQINVIYADLDKTIKDLQKNEYIVIGTSLNTDITPKSIMKYGKCALLLGNEANGVNEELLKQTDINVKIEINNKLESLNVAVAGSILMYYLSE